MKRFLLLLLFCIGCNSEPDFTPLFNGHDLTGWVNVNGAPSTWTVRENMIVCSGIPTGVLRTIQHYENFILELEWRHVYEGGNAGVFVYSDPIPVRGQPFTRSVEAQVMDGNHGDVFAIQGATMEPDRPHPQGWMRSLPIEERANPFGEWNHYRIESRDGQITLAVNGKIVSGGSKSAPRKGYICLESEGSEVHFRNIRIKQLPSSNPPAEEIAGFDDGFVSLYNGVDLSGWKKLDGWQPKDWILEYTGILESSLETTQEFGDFDLIVDWRFRNEDGLLIGTDSVGVLLRGIPVWIKVAGASADERIDREPGEWNRFEASVEEQTIEVRLNGSIVITSDTELRQNGPVGLIGRPGLQFANMYVRASK